MPFSKIAYETHPVLPERKKELNKQGFKIIDARFAPARDPLDHDGDGRKGGSLPKDQRPPAGDGYPSDDELRAAIEAATGKAPHHKAGRAKLIELFEASKSDPQNETASNGLTRRDIEADLTAMEVEFEPADKLDDLAALRDLAREERAQAGA